MGVAAAARATPPQSALDGSLTVRILLAAHHFPPRYTGGAEWRTHRTARALQARGHTVRVVCVERIDSGDHPGLAWQDEEYQGVAVRRLFYNLKLAPDPFRWEYDNEWIGDHFRALVQEWRPDLVHLISGYLLSGRVLLEAQAQGVPAVVTLTDFWFLCRRINLLRSDGRLSSIPVSAVECAQCQGEERRRYRWMGRWFPGLARWWWSRQSAAIRAMETRQVFLREALRAARFIICPSEFLRSVFAEAGLAPERLVFSRQGHDFSRVSAEAMTKTPSAELRLGCLGQVAPHKGVHVLFEAVRRLPEASVSVWAYGDTTAFPRYTRRLQQLAARDARLHLAGVYERHNLSQVLREVDVLVIPSLWYENSPNSILEAYAHHTPVIASQLGGMAELVKDGESGLHFSPGDPAALARQIQRLVTEPDLLPRLRQGIPPVTTLAQEMDALEEIYQRALESGAPTKP